VLDRHPLKRPLFGSASPRFARRLGLLQFTLFYSIGILIMSRFHSWVLGTASVAIAAFSLLGSTATAQAADEVKFRYGILRFGLSVKELTDFATTGEQSPVVERYLTRTNSNPAEVRQILNYPVAIETGLLDKALNNPAANLLLDELDQIIQTPDNSNNREALRQAMLTSTKTDNQLTLLEVIQNYPRDEIHLDVKRAVKTYENIAKYQDSIGEALKKAGSLRDALKKQGINLPDFLK